MGKLHSKHGDSFAVNASLARKGLEDWMVKQKYPVGSGGSSSGGSSLRFQPGCHHRTVCRLSGSRASNLGPASSHRTIRKVTIVG
ncbi:hypothetical protein lerEdw1_000885 [Lerista edwardsae]|nr:hypothetical protein lerEdw1_000885 [Lerista edwardsae]